ncbi:hypothetical protein Csa_001659, partial [Cucumis sativus]
RWKIEKFPRQSPRNMERLSSDMGGKLIIEITARGTSRDMGGTKRYTKRYGVINKNRK